MGPHASKSEALDQGEDAGGDVADIVEVMPPTVARNKNMSDDKARRIVIKVALFFVVFAALYLTGFVVSLI